MSKNAEPRKSTEAANQALWESLTDRERTAVNAAMKAFADAPGTSDRISMLYAIRMYQAEMAK